MDIVLPIQATAFYGGLLGIVYFGILINVMRTRQVTKTEFGLGDDPRLEQAFRVQANFVEYVPLILIILGAIELLGLDSRLVHSLGGLLLVSRVLHALGLGRSTGTSPGRFLGTLGTWLVLLVASGSAIYMTLI